MDKDGKILFLLADGKLSKIDPEKPERKPISFNSEFELDAPGEKAYLFEHVWRQVLKKFYDQTAPKVSSQKRCSSNG